MITHEFSMRLDVTLASSLRHPVALLRSACEPPSLSTGNTAAPKVALMELCRRAFTRAFQ
eukprot:766060-Hanusia_phi.AAC.2